MFTNSKYIASLTLGYICNRMWGEDKPTIKLGWFWFIITPLFFGSVGASLVLKKIKSYYLGYGAVCIFMGLIIRIIAVCLISLTKQYTYKERLFMAVSWIPKATVQAALSGIILQVGTDNSIQEIEDNGLIIQTVSIFSILICAPIGAVLINTLGPFLLTKSGDVQSPSKLSSEPKEEQITLVIMNKEQPVQVQKEEEVKTNSEAQQA